MKKISLFFAALFCVASVSAKTIYFKPTDWISDGAWFAAWTWGGSTADAWVIFADTDADGIYEGEFADDRTGCKFLRMSPNASEPMWDNPNDQGKWNESDDITLPTDGKNFCTFEGWEGTGYWSTFGENGYHLVGYIDNADNNALTDNNLFTGEPLKLTVTFANTSYVGIKDNYTDTYWSAAYVDATGTKTGEAILAKGNGEKLGVPAGEITFTLLENSDGTLTLSFAEKSASTALENAEAQKVEARKVIENGQIYIIRNGVRYNALGAQVK